ncbi:uncharacterized protein LOC112493073 [Ziziphus jujuba]|uniref:Uncharacterized protein LOC112493073 n=2 Tax=Ziziphus jujuba TaxID=326968 RepID=A0A6P6GHW7_ZIZJJ|nr:uncharacterized protein LOC112493073 [Ziziphus jujuba]KAH7515689.1 hypothetical protein FEM48_Zijuj10G0053200 [Ziziphus jujuba var. spinosa]
MAIKHCKCLSLLLFLAMFSIFLAGIAESRPVNLCGGADYKRLCQKIVKGQNSPLGATYEVVHQLISETKRAKRMLSQSASSKSQAAQICKENFDDALFDLHVCITNQNNHDKGSFNSNLSAVVADYVACDDAYTEAGQISPVDKLNKKLQNMADIGLYLETLVH